MEELEVYQPAELQFRIEDDERASWAMKKLRVLVSQMKANESLAAKERKEIDDWLEDVNGGLATDARYFEGLLIDYMRRETREPQEHQATVGNGKEHSQQAG